MPVKTGGYDKEMTTPTGAAILAASVDQFIRAEEFTECKSAYGIGMRKLDRPNVLRVSWRETAAPGDAPWLSEELTMLQANIDDLNGEELGILMERLFERGALDVSFVPCTMKKSRPGTVVSVLSARETLDPIRELLFRTATIGFRETLVRRLSLRREEETLRGSFGEARKKTVFLGNEALRFKIEAEDRSRIAREKNISPGEADALIRNEDAGGADSRG
jgi:uncharacterized protein (DUF111 family)